ncbi:MAG TPA: nuclear transport factor 2 family protein [Candidatus Thermoplasmatota archaeon]|jgi:steroid delta-isomerase-like uncharacterized protein|nr:nuclear transport factor 2 family protein [Candidatus Thermoplasmatota archaeon]
MPTFDVDGWIEAIERKDTERFLDHFADDAEVQAENVPIAMRGKDTMRRMFEKLMPTIRDINIKTDYVVQNGHELGALVKLKATFDRDYEFAGERLPVAGKTVEIPAAFFARLDDDGRITHASRLRDSYTALRQLGITGAKLDEIMERVLEAARATPPEEMDRLIRTGPGGEPRTGGG